MKSPEKAVETLSSLKALGVQISMDDFGTGYSSLSLLKRLPIDTLKVDKSFVSDLRTDGGDASIISAIIAMARSLNLNVIAEGVEQLSQLAFLRARGCNLIQGFLISRALPAVEMASMFADGAKSLSMLGPPVAQGDGRSRPGLLRAVDP